MRLIDNLILLGWLAFWLTWIVLAFKTKKSVAYQPRGLVLVRLGTLISWIIVIHVSLGRVHHTGHYDLINHNNVLLIIGAALFAIGVLLAVWARIYLGGNWGLPMTLKEQPELVTGGPYHFIRHPIYSGILLAIIGSALAINTYWLIILIFAGIYFVHSAYVEERVMSKEFPKTYPVYKHRSKMFIPFIY